MPAAMGIRNPGLRTPHWTGYLLGTHQTAHNPTILLGLVVAGLCVAWAMVLRTFASFSSRVETRGAHIMLPTAAETDEIRSQLIAAGLCSTVSGSGSTLTTDRGTVFVKVGTGGGFAGKQLLEYEAEGLRRMAEAATTLTIPRPWLVGSLGNGNGFLVMDFLKRGAGSGDLQRRLGRGLAEMHLAPADHPTFGFPMDGRCGSCRQLNNADAVPVDWVTYWRQYRLGDQLGLLRKANPGDRELQEKGARLMDMLPELFSMIDVKAIRPSLLHGDLWSGNYCSDAAGNPAIFDPAPYYGHHEADLGIARMFGGFGPGFWEAYHEVIPRAPGYERRALLYELHHHLNHYNMFGSGYRSGALDLMSRLLSGR